MNRLFWIDLEMTGLDEKTHVIIEAAAIITDMDFNPIQEYQAIVYQPPEELAKMDEWCVKTHGESGLTAAIPGGKKIEQVDQELLEMVAKNYRLKDRPVICGNSINNDRRFIDKYLPKFASRLHYRMIDVSSYKEIFKHKYGVEFKKKNAHRAVGDIYESINELKFYLEHVKIPPKPEAAETEES